ncbi:imelysin family protein [Aquamicrobium terrae]
MKSLALALAFSLFIPAATQAAMPASDVIGQAVEGFVRPAYGDLAEHAAALETAVEALCKTPSQDALDSARAEFGQAAQSWSKVELIMFGPIREGNRLERLLFWPDRKSIGLKQVQAALAAKDPDAADPDRIAGKSVAMQGFGALEYVLFGTDSGQLAGSEGAYRCSFGAAVAGNIAAVSAEVRDAWNRTDGFAAIWGSPGPDNPVYRNGSEAVTELMGVFINGLEMVRDVRLRGFLGSRPEKDKPKQALYWRSQGTTASLAANLEGLHGLFRASHLADALSPEARWIAESIEIQLTNGAEAARSLQGPVEEVLADPARREKLDYYGTVASSLSNLFGVRLSGEFGLTAGFSSLDGD